MSKLSRAELESGLAQFIGTESYTRHGMMRRLLLTEGVVWLQEKAECYWLVDAIASHMATNKRLQGEHFQTWDFRRRDDDIAPRNQPHTLEATDGNDGPAIVRQGITFSDFPLPTIRFFAVWDGGLEGWVLMLPGEY